MITFTVFNISLKIALRHIETNHLISSENQFTDLGLFLNLLWNSDLQQYFI